MISHSNNELLVPIIIGITGHRDIAKENYKILGEKIKEILSEIKSLCTNSPIVLLSPLADGADRIGAKVALEMGIDLVVPLPMKKEEYEMTFSEESKVEFRELISKAKRYFQVSINESSTSTDMSMYYENLGVFIAENSHMLIALWNGIDNGKSGGTSEVVKYKLKGVHKKSKFQKNLLSADDNGPVYHIATPRIQSEEIIGERFSMDRKFPGIRREHYDLEKYNQKSEKAKIAYNRVLEKIDEFNKDIKKYISKNMDLLKNNIGYVVDEKKIEEIDYETKIMIEAYGCADVLSGYYQNISVKVQKSLFILAVVAVLFFELYAHMFDYNLVLLFYPLTVVVASLIYYLAQKKNVHNKYIDYRAIAEGFRVQIYWRIINLDCDAADFYLRKQKTEMNWIRYVLKSHNIYKAVSRNDNQCNSIDNIKYVMENWVRNQFNYYKRKGKEHKNNFENQESKVNLFFWGGIFIAIALLAMEFFKVEIEKSIHHLLIIIMGLAPAIAAAIGGYTGKMAFSEQQKRYKRMEEIFEYAENYLEVYINEENIIQAEEIIFEIGKDALLENGDWVILHREKPMALPKG